MISIVFEDICIMLSLACVRACMHACMCAFMHACIYSGTGWFSHKYPRNTPYNSPVVARYWVFFFVDPVSDWYSSSMSVIFNAVPYNIGSSYNGPRLRMKSCSTTGVLSTTICRPLQFILLHSISFVLCSTLHMLFVIRCLLVIDTTRNILNSPTSSYYRHVLFAFQSTK